MPRNESRREIEDSVKIQKNMTILAICATQIDIDFNCTQKGIVTHATVTGHNFKHIEKKIQKLCYNGGFKIGYHYDASCTIRSNQQDCSKNYSADVHYNINETNINVFTAIVLPI